MASIPEKDILRDACAVFGCVTTSESSKIINLFDIACLGLTGLQHRGQESSGIVICNDQKFKIIKGEGLVSTVYKEQEPLPSGQLAIGHNRYSTTGESNLLNCQPFVVHTIHGQIAVAHNGELINAAKIRKKLLRHSVGLSTESDSELITQLLVHEPANGEPCGPDWLNRIKSLMNLVPCSYSVVLMTSSNEIFAFRDPFGNRPLCIGQIKLFLPEDVIQNKKLGDCEFIYVVSSESCVFPSLGGNYIREVKPGEIIRMTKDGVETLHIMNRPQDRMAHFCIFEYVYFARADSRFEGQIVYTVRKECGRQLAIESAVDADIVSTIPDSANPAARGFSLQSGIPFEPVVVKNRYTGRTFIQPTAALRIRGIATKFGPISDNIKDKRIILIDDSIVRGNTMPHIVELLRNAGAKEIHIRIASPPLKHPCFMGVNIPTKEELIANKYGPIEMARHFKADSVVYLSIDGLQQAVNKGASDQNRDGHCKACLTGKYPVELDW